MRLHVIAAQRAVVQHLFTTFGIGVEHDALAEDRSHERVGGTLIEVLVRRLEEELVHFRTGQQDNVSAHQLEGADVAAFVAHTLHERDGIDTQFLEMAVFVLAARYALGFGESHVSSLVERCDPV